MRAVMLFLGLFSALATPADLSRIEADGVTEVGGAPQYARMLPRTGSDGRLAASLLPPVADWASQPIPHLYYVSAAASTQGNGSPQYPFNTLSYALSSMSAQSALLVVPGAYSGTCTVQADNTVTLFGMGDQSYISSLTVSAVGSSAATTLDLHGLRVGTLHVTGGRINIRLAGTSVELLSGSSDSVTVTRADMGVRVDTSTLAHTDVYVGSPTAPSAETLVTPEEGISLSLSGGRGIVVDGGTTNVVAYVTDIEDTVAQLSAAMSTLEAADESLRTRIAAEESGRQLADQALSNNLASAIATLATDFGELGSKWGSDVTGINTRIGQLDTRLTTLDSREAADVVELNAAVSDVRSDYAAADTALEAVLRGVVSAEVDELRGDVPGIADARATTIANARIGAVTNSVISAAVARADANAIARENTISNRVNNVQAQVTTLQGLVAGHTSSIANLVTSDTQLGNRITALETASGTHGSDIAGLKSAVSALQSWKITVTSQIADINADIGTVKNRINSVIDCLDSIVRKAQLSDVTLPEKF